MKLRRLELRGFKTFAHHTELLFPSGITAFVGPNGSGKSNVADAIRWVLGEQSLRVVRGKRTEDVIFAGTSNRAPAGMAEVSITLDNSSGWLPVAFSEVTISRRAYRSGENEYLLNGNKVRLRDLNELLLKAGLSDSAFVVVGQGLVDMALSLRAEERRALIDEAANIKRFHLKLQETHDKLGTTDLGLSRARDLLNEIAPRLVTLSEQAERLRQHQELSEQLRGALRLWYEHARDQLTQAREAVATRLDGAEHEAAGLRERLSEIGQQLAAADHEEATARARIATWQQEAAERREEAADLRRTSAVLVERQQALSRRQHELSLESDGLRRSLDAAAQEAEAIKADCFALEAALERDTIALAQSESLHSEEVQRQEQEAQRIWQARSEVVRFGERKTALTNQRQGMERRRQEIEQEIARWEASKAANVSRAQQATPRVGSLEAAVELAKGTINEIDSEGAKLGEATAVAEEKLQQLGAHSRRMARELDERRARLEVLERWREGHSAYSAGVRTVLQAATPQKGRPASLGGIVGAAADLLRVPEEFETAIEVALGGRAQDIVVERWIDAEAAIALLKGTGTGRATFLPMDTLRVSNRGGNPLALNEGGVRGVAADLVGCEPRYKPIVEHLLGRTLIAQDLAVARRALDFCPSGWQIVTLEGEIVRSSGAVTGGARKSTDAGLLARHRELRALQQEVAKLERDNAVALTRHNEEREAQVRRRRQLADLNERRRETELALRKHEAGLAEARGEERMIGDERRWAETAIARQNEDKVRLDDQVISTEAERTLLEDKLGAARRQLDQLEVELKEHAARRQAMNDELASLRTGQAVRQRELAGRKELLATREHGLEQTRAQLHERETRCSEVEAEAVRANNDERAVEELLGGLDVELARLDGLLAPMQHHLNDLGRRRRDLEEEAMGTRERLAMCESYRREAASEVDRLVEQALQSQQQAAAELGPAVAAEIWRAESILPPPEDAPRPEELKRHVDRARASLRNLGMVNPDAIAEHSQTAARHDFLLKQVEDLEEGGKALRRLSLELQKTMRKRFQETFSEVAAQFRHYFVRLFGGGSARLVLTQPDDVASTGIEIVAQPPGRRLQNLALLSGGERALTAAALLFAMLAVRPIPLCVLDEVDAALDESNVGRFCEALRDLSKDTQFIVITHNRSTMQVADSLFGISMPTDSISQAVSLRMVSDSNMEEHEHVQPAAAPR